MQLFKQNLYSEQKGNHNLNVSSAEINVALSIMLLSGYHRLPNKRMYWQNEPECKVPIIADAIHPRSFEDILRYLHLNDNSKVTENDRYYKVRHLSDFLNNCFKQVPAEESVCVNEIIVPYYGKYPTKQFIKGKLIRFGLKLWVLAKSNLCVSHAEPYCGAHTYLPDTGLGLL
ncbi:hypothetical protein ILUMI_10656 [Ignelater luminosus]|uniref:PiggyBac transposable element-derived protein domain-containing protein n=1 Tax=Ignelater luminosus TaxID=2038154 RepID=A0A8K0D2V9_IGNLU|nr:hypothetical protein ILUMI_10656 [Ignelater luminosus]